MKSISKLMFLSFVAVTSFWACKKEENKTFYEGGTAPVLSASTDVLNLVAADSNKTAITFSWSNPNYLFTTGISSHDVNYVLEIDNAGASFSSPVKQTLSLGSQLSVSYTVAEFNNIMVNDLKLVPGVPHNIEMRLLANIDNVEATKLVSNVVPCKVALFVTIAPLYYMYVPGSYQGWAPDQAPTLGSFNKDLFEGYVNFSDPANEFKFTSAPDWGHVNYGDGGAAGTLSKDGSAGNLKLADAGYYKLNVDIPNLAWTYTKTTWQMIGQATPSGWGAGTNMTYNAADKSWEIASIALSADEFKFRANDDWAINFGDDPASDYLKYGGDNLKVTDGAGNYKVVLDLSKSPKYTYTLTKL